MMNMAPNFGTNPVAIPGLNKLQVVIGYLAWGASAVALIGIIIAGARLALEYQPHERKRHFLPQNHTVCPHPRAHRQRRCLLLHLERSYRNAVP